MPRTRPLWIQRSSTPEYDRELGLPASKTHPNIPWLSRRYSRLVVAVIGSLLLVPFLLKLDLSGWRRAAFPDTYPLNSHQALPPLYGRFHEYELQTSELHAEPDTKYFFFGNHAHQSGWGNIMQELILHSHLAYRLDRSFVYYNYTWNRDGSQYSTYNGHKIPSTIPLTALLQGPTTGSASSLDPYMPRAVTEGYYRRICPPEQRRQIDSKEVADMLGHVSTAGSLTDKWVEVMSNIDDKCVELDRDAFIVFDIGIMGDASRLLDVWPSLSHSPIVREFAWSPLVELAFDINREHISPSSIVSPYHFSQPFPPTNTQAVINPSAERYSQVPGLLALHIRRGDFVDHCTNLARWGSSWVGFNSFQQLPDKFAFPSGLNDDERIAYQRPHCFPNIQEIVDKAAELQVTERVAGRGELKDVYIMTNGPTEWVSELKAALRAHGSWRTISNSRDLLINDEQRYVKQAVDMLIGQRAQVFVGNGFSSLSGMVTMLRVANDISPSQCRML